MFPGALQEQVVAAYPSLYAMEDAGYATLKIRNGRLDVSALAGPGFGCAVDPTGDDLGDPGLPR